MGTAVQQCNGALGKVLQMLKTLQLASLLSNRYFELAAISVMSKCYTFSETGTFRCSGFFKNL